MDSTHAIARVTSAAPKKHPAHHEFCRALSRAIFVINTDDEAAVCRVLSQRLPPIDLESMEIANPEYIHSRIRRTIPSPNVLAARITEVADHFKGLEYTVDGVALVNQKVAAELTALRDHALKNCLSDPPGIALHNEIKTDRDGLKLFRHMRGNSHIESSHQKLNHVFHGMYNAGLPYVCSIIVLQTHRYNVDASVRHRAGFPKIGHYSHDVIEDINKLHSKVFGQPRYSFWTPESLMLKGPSTFGLSPPHRFAAWEDVEAHHTLISNYPRNLQFLAQMQRSIIPYAPVSSNEEWSLFLKHILSYAAQPSGRTSQASSIDFDEFADHWNSGRLRSVSGNHHRSPTPSVRDSILLKTASFIEKAYGHFLRHFAKKQLLLYTKNICRELRDNLSCRLYSDEHWSFQIAPFAPLAANDLFSSANTDSFISLATTTSSQTVVLDENDDNDETYGQESEGVSAVHSTMTRESLLPSNAQEQEQHTTPLCLQPVIQRSFLTGNNVADSLTPTITAPTITAEVKRIYKSNRKRPTCKHCSKSSDECPGNYYIFLMSIHFNSFY